MSYWSRKDTKEWVMRLEGRIEDISHYIDKTLSWCEERYIDNDQIIFMCCFLTAIWVSQLRDEPITYVELMEMLGIKDVPEREEKFYELDDKYIDLTHIELLEAAVRHFEG
jgi:hypothetical protein